MQPGLRKQPSVQAELRCAPWVTLAVCHELQGSPSLVKEYCFHYLTFISKISLAEEEKKYKLDVCSKTCSLVIMTEL